MRGWLFHGAHKPLEQDDPHAGPGEVVIKTRAGGLCHSDVGRLEGTLGAGFLPKPPPLILGHEVAGDVIEIGTGVTDYKVGDRVVVSGTNEFCPGRDADGGYGTQCVAPTFSLIRLPESVSYVQGAAATDAGQTSHGALMTAGELKPGMRVGIVGLGGLGMTGARIAVLNGAEVWGAEPRVEAWDTALQQGVKGVVKDVRELAPLKLDLIVDFAGFGDTTAGAIEAIGKGGIVVQVGLGRTEALISTSALIRNRATLRGSSGGTPVDTGSVIGHMAKGDLEIAATTISFEEIPAGLERLKRGGVIGRIVAAMD
jgi:propanol-preferring alcohol dehydrogenase